MSAATTMPHTPWPTVKLGDVCALKNGYTPKAEELSEQGVIPYFRISAMNFEGNEKRMIKPTAWLVSKKRCFNAGSIVFPKNGGAVYTRKVRVLEHDSVVDLNTGVCTPDKKTIDCEYLYHWFSNLNITDVVVEGTIPFVDFGMLREVSIPLPPLDVQREIVAKVEAGLKEADGLVAHFKRLAALADDTFKAELDETFSTLNAPTVKLGDVARINGGFAFKSENYVDHGVRVIRISDFNELGFINDKIVRHLYDETLSSYVLELKDILLCMTGGTVGKSLFITMLDEKMVTNQRVATIKVKQALPEYVYQVILSSKVQEIIQDSKNSTNDNISMGTIKDFPIPLPSLDIQREIVGKLEAVKARCKRLKAEAERGLKAAEALRKAVLAEAFEQ